MTGVKVITRLEIISSTEGHGRHALTDRCGAPHKIKNKDHQPIYSFWPGRF